MSGVDKQGGDGGPLVSIIIVLYNSAEYIEACIASLASIDYDPIEVILVDNASSDSSVMTARREAASRGLDCLISCLNRNHGFAAANNHGFRLSRGEVVLLLNPDTEVYEDTITNLVETLQKPDIGIVGCKVYDPDGKTIQHAGGIIRDNGLTWHYGVNEIDEGQCDQQRDVAYVTGAALAVKRDVFNRVGLLDSAYFPAYFEETDLCLKARRLGYRVVYIPGARVIHHESTTTGKFTSRYYYLYHKNRIRFMLKNFSWRFLLTRALPLERRWLGMIELADQGLPLKKSYLVNILRLPWTLMARRGTERLLNAPRVEDTVSEL